MARKTIPYAIWTNEPYGIGSHIVEGQAIKDAPRFAVRKVKDDWLLDHVVTGAFVIRHRLKKHCELLAKELQSWSLTKILNPNNDIISYIVEIKRSDHFITFDDYLKFRD